MPRHTLEKEHPGGAEQTVLVPSYQVKSSTQHDRSTYRRSQKGVALPFKATSLSPSIIFSILLNKTQLTEQN
jgi:hypothetical protein